jgi:hypothetical protein
MSGEFRAALFVPDGVGIRNFVLGPFLKELARRAHVDLFHILPEDLAARYAAASPAGIDWQPLSGLKQGRTISLLQSSLAYAHMYWANTGSMQRAVRKPVRGRFTRRMFIRSARALGRAGAEPRCIRAIDAVHVTLVERLEEVRAYRRLFERTKPSVVFSTSQRHYSEYSLLAAVVAARQLGIPTATFIVSWDNLSSKGRIVAPFDHYFVWSRTMREELRKYYPQISEDRIHVVGTPQFDPYGDPGLLWSREEFFRRIGGDAARRLICFSGGDAETCPEDPEHVRVLLEQIRSGRIRGNPQVLVRPSPADDGARYRAVRARFPELIFAPPAWLHPRGGDWTRIIPEPDDIAFLANLTHHADLNVNLGSTMTLDFGLHDKPVVNVAFDIADPPLFGMPVYDYYYHYEHFLPVVAFGASRIARAAEALPEHINAYLENPALDREGRRRLVDLHVDVRPGESSRWTVEALERIAGQCVNSKTP